MSQNHSTYTVLGAGSWGTALAKLLAENARPTTLWGRDSAQISAMAQTQRNAKYLGDAVVLPQALKFSDKLDDALSQAEVVLVVTPCHYFRQLISDIKPHLERCQKLVWACKGLELDTGRLLNHVAEEVLGNSVQKAVISGPNFALEVAQNMPSATTVAGDTLSFADEIASDLHNDWFRAYSSEDMIGVQLGGALKNGLAIASGIADGLGFGSNTRAALITRGLQEVSRLVLAMGGNAQTLMGLAGVGDLMMSCTDNQSRNRRMGLLLAKGDSVDTATAKIGQVVEGVKSVKAAKHLAETSGIELPILQQVYQVLYEHKPPQAAVEDLLSRDQKVES